MQVHASTTTNKLENIAQKEQSQAILAQTCNVSLQAPASDSRQKQRVFYRIFTGKTAHKDNSTLLRSAPGAIYRTYAQV